MHSIRSSRNISTNRAMRRRTRCRHDVCFSVGVFLSPGLRCGVRRPLAPTRTIPRVSCRPEWLMKGRMECYGLTDVGRSRVNNEDQFLIADLSKSMRIHQTSLGLDDQTRLFGSSQGILLLVADGMGGQAAGELASRIAVDALTRYLLNTMHWFWR